MLIGAIADDLTGATDIALTLTREGMRTLQVVGAPKADVDVGDADAVVVALKSRTIPAAEAVRRSLEALDWLLQRQAEQIVFKYCSTFDSTPAGNIGPVLDALQESLGTALTIACPAFPANGRSVYQGHLFVGDLLLSDSPMRRHPLTPMTDANLVRVLGRQSRASIGLVPFATVSRGPEAIRTAFDAAIEAGTRVLIVDAVADDQLRAIGKAAAGLKLLTGSSGVAMGLPDNFRAAGKLIAGGPDASFPMPSGRGVILAGSCSAATMRQVAHAIEAGVPGVKIDPRSIASKKLDASAVADGVARSDRLSLVYSTADPQDVAAAQNELGREAAGELVEKFLGSVAHGLRERGFRRFVVAGGETSGAVIEALGVSSLRIGLQIDPGVPWTLSSGETPLALALKSGNFGTDDFFLKAWSGFA